MRGCPLLLKSTPLALLFWARLVSAQTTGVVIGMVTDALTGEPIGGAAVVATSPALQGSQTARTDVTGAFRLMLLPPGLYKLEATREGYRPAERNDIALRVDTTLRANLVMLPETVKMEEQIIHTGMAPVIDVGSAETGVVVTKDTMTLLPLGRSFQETEALAPTARRDKFGFGFAGAQSSENNYLVDGLNVTDPRFGTLGTDFLPNFFEQIDLKTGSYMPEYGHSIAGIVSGVLKSGSNELHGSAWLNLTPRFLFEPDGQPSGRSGEAVWIKSAPGHGGLSGGAGDLDAGFELGGPIQKDQLWFYLGFAPVLKRSVVDRYLRWTETTRDADGNPIQHDIPGTDHYYSTVTKQFQTVGKLTYLLEPEHNLSLSLLWAPKNVQGFDASLTPDPSKANGSPSTFLGENWSETVDLVGRYSGKFLDRHLIVEAQTGFHYQFSEDRPGIVDGVNQATTPFTRWGKNTPLPLSNFEEVPSECSAAGSCEVLRYLTGGQPSIESYTLQRFTGRLSTSYLFQGAGAHTLKGGLDLETSIYHDRSRLPGDASFWFADNGIFLVDTYGTVTDGVAEIWNGLDVRARGIDQAYYLQDSWQVVNTGLTLNYGIRWELQSLENTKPLRAAQLAAGDTPQKISIDDNIAPRFQAIYDFTGQGRGKIAASWGRFYQSLPLYLADRSFGGVSNVEQIYSCTGGWQNNPSFDPRTAPGCTSLVGPYQFNGVSPVAPDLKGSYVDQLGLAAEYEVIQDLAIGVEWQARRLGRAIEDMSSDDGYTFFIANPGESRPWTYNGNVKNPLQVTSIDPATGLPYTINFPKPQRDYDGLTLKVTKALSNNWMAQASYTYSVLRGNYSGMYRQEKGMATPTPNLTTDYDAPSLMQNRTGLLPDDVTHQLKLFGAYVFRVSPRLNITAGGAVSAQSGTPLSALGSHPLGGRAEAYIIPRGQAGRTSAVTQVDLKGQLDYLIAPTYVLKFSLEIFNLFNSQTPTQIDQNYTYDPVQPIVNAQCTNRNGANATNPIAGLQADCPDLRQLKTTDGRPVTVNSNYGKPLGSPGSFQLPISVRLGAALTF